MQYLKNGGITLKFMAMLANTHHSTISRYVSENGYIAIDSQRRNARYAYLKTREILSNFIVEKNKIEKNKSIHSFFNFKGGTGKTSLCYQASMHLALCGYKILLIDADPQSHLTLTLGVENNNYLPTLYDGIVNNMSLNNIKVNIIDGIDLIPSNLSLTNIEVRMSEMIKKEEVLKRYVEPFKNNYDFIIFDCHPMISNLNRNILNVSNVINVVCETHPYSMLGMKILFEDLERFYSVMEIKKPEIIIIPNKYEDRSNLSGEAISILHKYYGEYLESNFAIRRSEEFPKSARDMLPVSYFCKSNSNAFEDLVDLVHLILKKSTSNKKNMK